MVMIKIGTKNGRTYWRHEYRGKVTSHVTTGNGIMREVKKSTVKTKFPRYKK